VADVVAGLIAGEIVRDERPLTDQVKAEVRRRAQAYQRAREGTVFVSLDEVTANAQIDSLPDASGDETDVPTRDAVDIVRRIREFAVDDDRVLQLIELHERGVLRLRVARSVGMSPHEYRRARARLAAYAARATAAQLADLAP